MTRLNKIYWVVFALAVTALGLGTWGYQLVAPETHPPLLPPPPSYGFWDAFYRALQLFVLNREDAPGSLPWQVQLARFVAPATTLGGVWLFLDKLPRWLRLFLRTRAGGHHIVCGLGRKGMATVRASIARVIAIERHGEPADLQTLDALGVPLVRGSATEPNQLLLAGVMKATQITIACGTDDEDVRIARLAMQLIAEPLFTKLDRCRRDLKHTRDVSKPSAALAGGDADGNQDQFVGKAVGVAPHLDDAETRALLREWIDALNRRLAGVSKLLTAARVRHAQVRFDYLDYCHQERAARHLFEQQPLDRAPIDSNSPSYPHLVLIGFGRMGQAVLRQALHIAHYPNAERLRVDIFDAHATRLWRHFCGRHPNFEDTSLLPIADVQLHDGNVIAAQHLKAIEAIVGKEHCQVTIVIAVDTETEAALIVSHLPQLVAERDVPVCVRVEAPGGLAEIMRQHRQALPGEPLGRKRPQVHLFGYTEATVPTLKQQASEDALARMLHENYRMRFVKGKPTKRSQLPWAQLDEEFRDSNRRAADLVTILFRSLGYERVPSTALAGRTPLRTDEPLPGTLARWAAITEHGRWYAERYLAGWKLADPPPADASEDDKAAKAARDFVRRRHASMVPWHQLPQAEKQKDRHQVDNYLAALDRLGEAVVPRQGATAADPRA